uniref:ARAD1A02156p n=1 Tax=Blastobotrys adeninivorans TaxID=409370 RepID=A0A060SX70_BLAAD
MAPCHRLYLRTQGFEIAHASPLLYLTGLALIGGACVAVGDGCDGELLMIICIAAETDFHWAPPDAAPTGEEQQTVCSAILDNSASVDLLCCPLPSLPYCLSMGGRLRICAGLTLS